MINSEDLLYTPKQAANFLGNSIHTLAIWRMKTRDGGKPYGPMFVKDPGLRGGVFYLKSDLLNYLKGRRRASTSATEPPKDDDQCCQACGAAL